MFQSLFLIAVSTTTLSLTPTEVQLVGAGEVSESVVRELERDFSALVNSYPQELGVQKVVLRVYDRRCKVDFSGPVYPCTYSARVSVVGASPEYDRSLSWIGLEVRCATATTGLMRLFSSGGIKPLTHYVVMIQRDSDW